jgi:predicted nucleic acid-binding protein
MADRFFDTSAIAKHYRNEMGTARVDAFLAEASSRHLISALGVVELHSVFAKLVRTGHITAHAFNTVRGRFLADVTAGLWLVVPVSTAHFQDAQQLIVRHGLVRGLRTLDALQLAVTLASHLASPLDAFVSADANLCTVALAEGLAVVNPEVP